MIMMKFVIVIMTRIIMIIMSIKDIHYDAYDK